MTFALTPDSPVARESKGKTPVATRDQSRRDAVGGKSARRPRSAAIQPTPPYCLDCEADLERDGDLWRCKRKRCGRVLAAVVGSESGIRARVVLEGSVRG